MKIRNILLVFMTVMLLSSVTACAVPTVTIDSPTAMTYDTATIDLNWSVDETLSNAYYSLNNYYNITLIEATITGGTWSLNQSISTGDINERTAITTDTEGNIYISFYDYINNSLYLARWNGTWNFETVDDSANVGTYSSTAVGSDGTVYIAYYDATNTSLKLAKWDGSWNLETVDNTGSVGRTPSIAIGVDDTVYISYRDGTNTALKLAVWDGSWNLETVDNNGTVGYGTSIAVNPDSDIYIAYSDGTNDDLKLAKWNGSWNIEIVDSTGDVGESPSLELDADDNIYISYFDGTNGDVKLAKWNGSWNLETVIDVAIESMDMTVDAGGNIYIGYQDPNFLYLHVAKWNGTWINESLDESEEAGMGMSITTDPYDRVYISYWDNTNSDLNLAIHEPDRTVSPFNATITAPDGQIEMVVWARNTSYDLGYSSVTFTVDTVYPQISFVAPTPDDIETVQTASVTINLSVIEDNLDTVTLSWNGTNTTLTTYDFSQPLGADGIYEFYACANDTLDNVNCTETRTIYSEYQAYLESQETILAGKSLGEIPAGAILGLTDNVSISDAIKLIIIVVILGFGMFGYSAWSKRSR